MHAHSNIGGSTFYKGQFFLVVGIAHPPFPNKIIPIKVGPIYINEHLVIEVTLTSEGVNPR